VTRPYPTEPIGFAHRGAPGRGLRENTLPAFRAALRAGVPGIESDVWLTADSVPVLLHDGYLRRPAVRRRWLRAMPRAALPPWIPALEDLYAECGTAFELSLDLKDATAAPVVFAIARTAGPEAVQALWLCGGLEEVSAWRRTLGDEPRLVNSVRAREVPEGVPARVRTLRTRRIDVLNMHRTDWRPAWVTTVRESGCLAFGWDAQTPSALDLLLDLGCAGVYSDSVPQLLRALGRRRGPDR
jgi:glycerophosphoryl diester phosphodiesterase